MENPPLFIGLLYISGGFLAGFRTNHQTESTLSNFDEPTRFVLNFWALNSIDLLTYFHLKVSNLETLQFLYFLMDIDGAKYPATDNVYERLEERVYT